MENKVIPYKPEKQIDIGFKFCTKGYYERRRREAERARRRREMKFNTLRGISAALIGVGGFLAAAEVNDPYHWYMGCIIGVPMALAGVSALLKTEQKRKAPN